ncbi:MAG: threonine aldolase family protein, partial [Solirubrobacterales bacterium]
LYAACVADQATNAGGFASDNASGAHPAVIEAITGVNGGHVPAYGNDPETARLEEISRAEFGSQARIFPMLNGTGTNVAALRAIAPPHRAVICAETAHISIDETAAPEAIAGLKLLGVSTPDGKLTPELAATRLVDRADLPHIAWPAVLSVSQPTELGTVYRPEEVAALSRFARENGLTFHMDGARIFNAAASLGTGLAGASTANGVDVLSLGANKNGTVFGEAVVFATPDLADGFGIWQKGSLQLPAKARFVSAQLSTLLTDGLGLAIAGDANGIASLLAERLSGLEGVVIAQPVEANIVFFSLPLDAAHRFVEASAPNRPLHFEVGDHGLVRLVASWDSSEADVEWAVGLVSNSLGAAAS